MVLNSTYILGLNIFFFIYAQIPGVLCQPSLRNRQTSLDGHLWIVTELILWLKTMPMSQTQHSTKPACEQQTSTHDTDELTPSSTCLAQPFPAHLRGSWIVKDPSQRFKSLKKMYSTEMSEFGRSFLLCHHRRRHETSGYDWNVFFSCLSGRYQFPWASRRGTAIWMPATRWHRPWWVNRVDCRRYQEIEL